MPMPMPSKTRRPRWVYYLGAFLILVLVAFAFGRSAGRWLIVEDRLTPADAIVALSGSMPYRAEEAGRLFNLGQAPEIWLTRSESPVSELEKFGIHYVPEEEYSRQ